MDSGQVTEDRGLSVRRMAVITSAVTFAECPLECVCVSWILEQKKMVTCGHYQGSMKIGNGSAVNCGYQGR